MNKKSIEFALVVIMAVLLVFMWFSKAIGADFTTTSTAVINSFLLLGAAVAAWFVFKFRLGWVVLAPLPLIWPKWWPVLVSIANDGKSPASPEVINIIESPWYSAPWYITSYWKWGVEICFVILWIIYWKLED
ncbi:hypothetical protein KI809_09435 [Geobacter pelophilus]|uniref:Uncharacterized protein n=1 Tax=Geoanaerobacter pelophilus TaxID=60036 RepID=A0AAW4L897_9BACT|nr:hypothetical protein [Geoanaerobacter pelophilus]MBT0664521.1 hypothetical protein [Geoanaerobacter pelophilus]